MLGTPRQLYFPKVLIDIAPVDNALGILISVAYAKGSPGCSEWLINTREKLSDDELEKLYLLTYWIGLEAMIHTVQEGNLLPGFPEYLEVLSGLEAETLRDRLLYWMVNGPSDRLFYRNIVEIDDPQSILGSEEAYFAFNTHLDMGEEEKKLTVKLYKILTDPPALKSLILDYLTHFWEVYLEDDWNRGLPALEKAVENFKKVDVAGMGHFEIMETITHRNLRGVNRPEVLQEFDTLRFIPSMYTGPYVLQTAYERELRVTFGAHLLSTPSADFGAADTTHIANQMKALADETRLEIIQMLKREGEMATQEIIDRFQLSKSAASRYMRQLFSSGVVLVRMDEDGLSKFYRLNPKFMDQMQEMLKGLLG